jgi:hypothetical protein
VGLGVAGLAVAGLAVAGLAVAGLAVAGLFASVSRSCWHFVRHSGGFRLKCRTGCRQHAAPRGSRRPLAPMPALAAALHACSHACLHAPLLQHGCAAR